MMFSCVGPASYRSHIRGSYSVVRLLIYLVASLGVGFGHSASSLDTLLCLYLSSIPGVLYLAGGFPFRRESLLILFVHILGLTLLFGCSS